LSAAHPPAPALKPGAALGRVLIVGGDGLIGRALAGDLAARGWRVRATTRRAGPGPALDLATPFDAAAVTEGVDALVLSAAVTGRAACERDPAGAHRVNVEAPVALARPVLARGGQVVFLSTHIVLGGDRPFLPPDAPHAPVDVYSRQKAEAEAWLAELPGAAEGLSIVRLTKVLDWSSGVLAGWRATLAAGQTIEAYTDLVLAPVTAGHVVAALARLLQDRVCGVVHLSGAEEISFADLAFALAGPLGWPHGSIRPMAGRPVNPLAAASPRHASLAAERPESLDAVLRELTRGVQ